MLTGDEYKASLYDGRVNYIEGRQIVDPCNDPLTSTAVDWIARGYDRVFSNDAGATNPLMTAPRSLDELRVRAAGTREQDLATNTTYQALMTLLTVAPDMEPTEPEFAVRMRAYVADCLERDVRIAECITDAKGDRSLAPSKQSDPDAYVHVVSRDRDGIVIRGAKLHITGAALVHELLVLPTKRMSAGEEEYAVACAVPLNAPGVKIVNTSYAPRVSDDRHFPLTSVENMPDGFVIFDDVHVPFERVFLDGQTEFSGRFAHSLGLWERLGGTALMADEADMLVGLAQLVSEANGLARVDHIREKISELIVYATVIRGCLEAAITHAENLDGFYYPNELYTNAAKFYGAANYNVMVRNLHDLAGGAVVTAPTLADRENPATGPFIDKYMSTGPKVPAERRMRLFHAIRDVTADAFGGWHLVTNLQSGGGLYAQRIVTRKHYDMARAKRIAEETAGLA